jgi:hypothetical protein
MLSLISHHFSQLEVPAYQVLGSHMTTTLANGEGHLQTHKVTVIMEVTSE